jgi:predicted Zn-dependent protease
MVAKIVAFMEPPEQVRRKYPTSDNSLPAQMARAILAHRAGDTAGAVAMLDALLAKNDSDGFLHELKGQFLFEGGKVKPAIVAYARAAELLPKEPLIELGLGSAYLADEQTDAAITSFKKVTSLEKENVIAWRQLGIAYGKQNKKLESYAALAEEAVLRKDAPTAKRFIALAKPLADHDGATLLRLGDMEQEMAQWKDIPEKE